MISPKLIGKLTVFVVTATHAADQCPLSNAKVRKMFPSTEARMEAGKKFGAKVLVGPLFSINHKTIVVAEASSVDSVMDMLMELRIPQWNAVDIQPYMSADDAVNMFDKVQTIY